MRWVMQRVGMLAVVLGMVACGSQEEPRVVEVGGGFPAPTSLSALASEVRDGGGLVFVGEVVEAPSATDALRVEAPYEGLEIRYPRETSTVTVIDSLGHHMPISVSVIGMAGPPSLTQEDGTPSDHYVLSESSAEGWERQRLPEDGAALYFAYPQAGQHVVVWVAPLDEAGLASGEGTTSGEDVLPEVLALAAP